MSIKGALIAKYVDREPTEFYQYDGFSQAGNGPLGEGPDGDGDELSAGATTELMNGASVRVLIRTEATSADAARLLRKITRWVERDLHLHREQLEEARAAREAAYQAEQERPF